MCAGALAFAPSPAAAFAWAGGVSAGGMLAGTTPVFAVSPHLQLAWRFDSGFSVALFDMVNLFPPLRGSTLGIYNTSAIVVGFAWSWLDVSAGPAFSQFSMPSCRRGYCGHSSGLAPGIHGQVNIYPSDSFGVAVSGNVDWLTGRSLTLPDGVAALIVVGPVVRW